MPYKNLFPIFKDSSIGSLFDDTRTPLHCVGVLVIPDAMDRQKAAQKYTVAPEYIRSESTVSSTDPYIPGPTEYGIELPAPLLLGRYPSGSEYLFLPWASGLVCQGPFRQHKPYRVTCKHEFAAAQRLTETDGIFLPVDEGVQVPARARRFIAPQIALEHTPEGFDR
jgi:hypothetical protein